MNHAARKKLLLLLLCCLLLGSLLRTSLLLLRSFLLGHSTSSVKKSQLRIPSRGLTDELTALTKTKTTFNSFELFVRYNIPNVEQSKHRSGSNLLSKSSCTERRDFCNTFFPKTAEIFPIHSCGLRAKLNPSRPRGPKNETPLEKCQRSYHSATSIDHRAASKRETPVASLSRTSFSNDSHRGDLT